MKSKTMTSQELFSELLDRYPVLKPCGTDIYAAYETMKRAYSTGRKLLVAGNGGSAADSEHIVGELMKSFLFKREAEPRLTQKLDELYGEEGRLLAGRLEGALCAIPLTSMPALTSAFSNDVDAAVSFAQMICGYGSEGDVFLGISTSGNSKNILFALMVAKAKGLTTVALTGKDGGKCITYSDVAIRVPESVTHKIQELHLPVYHTLCAMLEADFFKNRS